MAAKIAINGFGRIGRLTFRRILENHPDLEVAAINDLTDSETLAHLLKYDSIYGIYGKEVSFDKGSLLVGKKKIKVFSEKDPSKLAWEKLGIDIVLECTGAFRDMDGAKKHLTSGAKKVIISAPGKSPEIPSFLFGINMKDYDVKLHDICDMGSCTTNCLAPLVKVLNDNFKIVSGFMTTVHSYTNDQRILDLAHKDLRRTRAAALNIIPTTTGATKAIAKVMPEIAGKLNGMALRVPTPTVSVVDLVCEVEKKVSADQVNEAFKKASAKESFKGILKVEQAPLVSSDYVGNSFSSVVDSPSTMVSDKLVKVLAWYDNEWGYASRLAEFAELVGKKL